MIGEGKQALELGGRTLLSLQRESTATNGIDGHSLIVLFSA